jgi:hypothetical protein
LLENLKGRDQLGDLGVDGKIILERILGNRVRGWIKRPGRGADHSRLSSAEVKNAWSSIPSSPILLSGVVLN